MRFIPVVVQHRHVHLSEPDQRALFGSVNPTALSNLSHKGQVVYQDTISIIGERGTIDNVRVFGPCRDKTQVELSATDAYALGIYAPLRLSGDLQRAGTCTLKGPAGEITPTQCAIIPARHIHCNEVDAKRHGFSHGQVVRVSPVERRGEQIDQVTVRIHPTYQLSFHITSDEAASYWLSDADHVVII